MKKLFTLAILALILVSCNDVKREHSETLYEKAIVIALIHNPAQHNTKITQTAYDDPLAFNEDITTLDLVMGNTVEYGVDYDGNKGIKIGNNRQITSTTIPEKHGVVFQCEHGTFTIEGNVDKYKILYDKLYKNVKDTVNILYQEEYLVTYETENNVKKQVSKVLNKLDFIDAQLLK